MLNRKFLISIFLLVCPFIFACSASYQPQAVLDKNWGRSYDTARLNQIVNPEAPENTDPITGLQGVAAMNNLDQYEKEFERDETSKTVFNIDLSK